MSLEQLANYLPNVTVREIEDRLGEIPHTVFAGKPIFHRSTIDSWIAAGGGGATTDDPFDGTPSTNQPGIARLTIRDRQLLSSALKQIQTLLEEDPHATSRLQRRHPEPDNE